MKSIALVLSLLVVSNLANAGGVLCVIEDSYIRTHLALSKGNLVEAKGAAQSVQALKNCLALSNHCGISSADLPQVQNAYDKGILVSNSATELEAMFNFDEYTRAAAPVILAYDSNFQQYNNVYSCQRGHQFLYFIQSKSEPMASPFKDEFVEGCQLAKWSDLVPQPTTRGIEF